MTRPTKEWTVTTLGEVATLQKGMTITAKAAQPGYVPVIAGGKKPAYFHAEANRPSKTITVSASGAYAGYVAFHASPIWASDCVTVFPANEQICTPEFLYYFMLSKQNEIYGLQRGSGMPHVYAKDLALLQISIPPLEEQRRIVETLDEHLSRLDKAQAELLAANSKLDVFRRSAIEALTLGDETWTTSSLGDVTNVNWGDTTLTKSSYRNAGFTAFSASGPDGFIDKYDFDQDGVVLSAIGAACGKVFFATGKWSGIKNTICITPKDSAVSAKYLYYFLNDANGWQKRGAAQPFIRQADARARKVRYPDLAKQQELIEALEAQITVFEILSKDLRNQVQQMMILRRSVLKMAFEGKLRGQ